MEAVFSGSASALSLFRLAALLTETVIALAGLGPAYSRDVPLPP